MAITNGANTAITIAFVTTCESKSTAKIATRNRSGPGGLIAAGRFLFFGGNGNSTDAVSGSATNINWEGRSRE